MIGRRRKEVRRHHHRQDQSLAPIDERREERISGGEAKTEPQLRATTVVSTVRFLSIP
ncbi:hypothetical protein U1Q18_017831, partial [Sarracenia purpurea var. burkii]